MTQARTKVGSTDRWLLGLCLALVAMGAVSTVLLVVAVPLLGLVFLVPVLIAGLLCLTGVLVRKRPAVEVLTTLRDGLAMFLAVGALGLLLGLSVLNRADVAYFGAAVQQRGTVTLTHCEQGTTFGWHGFGRLATCHGAASWAGGPAKPEQVVLHGSQLTAAVLGHAVPVAKERLLIGTIEVTRADGHPWMLAGLLVGVPLVLLALWLLVLVPVTVARPVRYDPVRRLRDRLGQGPVYLANRAETQVRRGRGKVGFAQTRSVPGWVVTGDLRRLWLAAVLLIVGGLATYLVRGRPPGLAGRAGLGTTIGALGAVLLVIAVQRIERRRRNAARISEYGPDLADALDSARERARRQRGLLGGGLGVLLGVVGLAFTRPMVTAIVGKAGLADVVAHGVPVVVLLAASGVLLVAASEDDRGWRGLMCSAVRAPMPPVPQQSRAALSARQLSMLDSKF